MRLKNRKLNEVRDERAYEILDLITKKLNEYDFYVNKNDSRFDYQEDEDEEGNLIVDYFAEFYIENESDINSEDLESFLEEKLSGFLAIRNVLTFEDLGDNLYFISFFVGSGDEEDLYEEDYQLALDIVKNM